MKMGVLLKIYCNYKFPFKDVNKIIKSDHTYRNNFTSIFISSFMNITKEKVEFYNDETL
jgi:hypothetical protein